MTEAEVVAQVKRWVVEASVRKVAKTLGVSATYVQGIVSGRFRPGPKVFRAMGLEREPPRYRKAAKTGP